MTNPEQPPVPAPPVPPFQPYGIPPESYAAPVAPYAAPQDPRYGQALQAPAPKRSAALGAIALALALVAAVGASVMLAIAMFQIALVLGPRLESLPANPDLGVLTPVREWVLLLEIGLWTGSILGIWALVQGIVAVVKRRGRGAGIAAIVIAVLGPGIAGLAALLGVFLAAGAGALA